MTTSATARATAAPDEGPFYITATAPPARPRATLKHNDSFVVLDSHGDIGAFGPATSDGLFDRDTRYLSRLALLLDGGAQPLLLASDVRDDSITLTADLTNPDILTDGHITIQRDTAHIARTIFIRDGSLRQRVAIANHGQSTLDLDIDVLFDADFADIFEVRGTRRTGRGNVEKHLAGPATVELVYEGLDRVRRMTEVAFEPRPTRISERAARFSISAPPGGSTIIFINVRTRYHDRPRYSFTGDLSGARRESKAMVQDIATVETSNEVVNEVLQRARQDLYILTTATPQGSYPYAGIPWYSTTFGRDGIITAMQMLWFDPRIARGVLARLAHFQASETDEATDAQPGKILHEMRAGEMAALKEVPFGLYYGSADSTPLFLVLAGLYAARTGDLDFIRRLWPAIERALDWMDTWGDPDTDGFIEYPKALDGTRLRNQGWKDSADAVFHADGDLAEGPIALVEVQGYAYLARNLIADCAERLGMADRAIHLRRQSEVLRQKFEAAFWCEDLKTYAIALDGHKRPCAVRTSNPGAALFTGIMREDRALHVATDLLRPHFFTGWGIRTVAQGEARFNPMSYHNGSVWPHDNAMIAAGLAHYGLKRRLEPIFQGMIAAAGFIPERRLPELFCGFRRRPGRGPTLYPVACSPQAWAAGAPFQLIEASLGLHFDVARKTISLRDPVVPSFIETIRIRNLRLGAGRADFSVQRGKGGTMSLQISRLTDGLSLSMSSAESR